MRREKQKTLRLLWQLKIFLLRFYGVARMEMTSAGSAAQNDSRNEIITKETVKPNRTFPIDIKFEFLSTSAGRCVNFSSSTFCLESPRE